MNASQTKTLIRKMIDSGKLMPETVEEMEDYLDDLSKGSLDKMDAQYVEGLARRLGFLTGKGGPASDAGDATDAEEDADEDGDEAFDDGFVDDFGDDFGDGDDETAERIAELEARLADAAASAAAARDAIDRAQSLVDGLKGAATGEDTTPGAGSMEALRKTVEELDAALAQAAEALPADS